MTTAIVVEVAGPALSRSVRILRMLKSRSHAARHSERKPCRSSTHLPARRDGIHRKYNLKRNNINDNESALALDDGGLSFSARTLRHDALKGGHRGGVS